MIIVPEMRPAAGPLRVRWEEPACPLCGGERRSPIVEAPDPASGLRFAVVRCDECGLQFTSPRPDRASINQFYRSPSAADWSSVSGGGRISLVDVLEHAHDPIALLTEAGRRLGPAGRLVVRVPNIESAAFRWFGPAWFGLDLPRHLTHFTPCTLLRMLDLAGFRATKLRFVADAEWMRSSARLAVRMGRRSPLQRALTCEPLAKFAAWACYFTGRADGMMAAAEVA